MEKDPDRELEERIQELSRAAMSDYVQDPLGSAIRSLEDSQRDYESFPEDEHHRGFVAGHGQAIHNLKAMYISYSGNFECDCRYTHPEEYRDGIWGCADCGETLVDESEDVVNLEEATDE